MCTFSAVIFFSVFLPQTRMEIEGNRRKCMPSVLTLFNPSLFTYYLYFCFASPKNESYERLNLFQPSVSIHFLSFNHEERNQSACLITYIMQVCFPGKNKRRKRIKFLSRSLYIYYLTLNHGQRNQSERFSDLYFSILPLAKKN